MKHQFVKNALVSFLLLLLVNCKDNQQKIASNNSVAEQNYAVEVSMEGQEFRITQNNLEPKQNTLFKKDSIQLICWEDGNPLKLNFNLFNTNVLNQGSATYVIPDANSGKVKVDLNFYNGNRDVKRMNKRIIFRKGTITISKISEKELHMTFEGEGSGILEYGKNFPISGHVDINY